MRKLFTFFFVFIFSGLCAEVAQIALRWDAKACKEQCAARLEKALKSIPSTAEVQTDTSAGQAIIRWKPRSRFYFQDINAAFRNAGITHFEAHMIVRGTISHAGKKFTLDSIGDNTAFELYSPLKTPPKNPLIGPSPDQLSLDPEAQKHLLSYEAGSHVVTITGTLLQPERSPPNRLIIQSIQGGVPDQNKNSPFEEHQNQPPAQNTTPRRSPFGN